MMIENKQRNFGILVISLLTLLTCLTLYYARSLDDNRLSSWQWCFQNRGLWGVFLAVLGGCILSYFLATVSFRTRNRGAVLFVVSFVSASFFWSEPEVIVDASRYFTQAKYLELYGVRFFFEEWGKGISAWTDMPLVPFLYGLIFRLFGEVRVYVQIFTAVLFSLSTVLTYRIGWELWDEEVGLYGGFFLLGMPYLFTQVPLLLVDIPAMFFLLFAVLMFMKALKKGGMMLVISAFSIFLAFLSKYSAWLMLSILPVIVLVNLAQERSKPEGARQTTTLFLRTSYIVLLSALCIGLAVAYKFGVISDQMNLLMAYQKPGLKRWGESFVSTFFFQIHPLITTAALYSVYVAVKKRDLKYIVAVWLVALVLLMQIRRARYIIMVLPMVSLTASYGLRRIEGADLRKFFAACVITSSLAVALIAYLPFMKELSAVNLKEAGKFLDSLPERNVEVFTLIPPEPVVNPSVSVPLLDFFTQKRIIYEGDGILAGDQREKIENSSLRFTLEFKNPSYYGRGNHRGRDTVLAVISESANDPLSPEIERRTADYSRIGVFDKYEGIFSYRTSVRIYRPVSSGRAAAVQ
jgi:hypothetical protein